MALKDLTLSALETTKLKHRFADAMEKVSNSLALDKDVPGDREINIKIVFKPKNGYNITTFKCTSKVPDREEGVITMMSESGLLQIETASADARQPGLPFDEKADEKSGGSDNVVSIEAMREQGRA